MIYMEFSRCKIDNHNNHICDIKDLLLRINAWYSYFSFITINNFVIFNCNGGNEIGKEKWKAIIHRFFMETTRWEKPRALGKIFTVLEIEYKGDVS